MRACGACRFRFPVQDGSPLGERCPACGGATAFVDAAFATPSARDARDAPAPAPAGTPAPSPGLRLAVLLDNVRSASNVGTIVRTCDALAVERIYYAGLTPPSDHPKVAKTALGAEQRVAWERHPSALDALDAAAAAGFTAWALEGGERSRSLFGMAAPPATAALVLVLGHEVAGVDPRVLERCAAVARLPMLGIKDSLNVATAFAAAGYWLRFGATATRATAAAP